MNHVFRTRAVPAGLRVVRWALLGLVVVTAVPAHAGGRRGDSRHRVDSPEHADALPSGWRDAGAAAPPLVVEGVVFLDGDVWAASLDVRAGAVVSSTRGVRFLVAGDARIAGRVVATTGDVVVAAGADAYVAGPVTAGDGAVGEVGGSVVLHADGTLTIASEVRPGRGGDGERASIVTDGRARGRGGDGGDAGAIALSATTLVLDGDARLGVRRGGHGGDAFVVAGTGSAARADGGGGGAASRLVLRTDALDTGGSALGDFVRSPDASGARGGAATARGGAGRDGSAGTDRCGARGSDGRGGGRGGAARATGGRGGAPVALDLRPLGARRAPGGVTPAADRLAGAGGAATALGGRGGAGGRGGDGAKAGRGGRGGAGGRAAARGGAAPIAAGGASTAAGGAAGSGGPGGDGCGRDGAAGGVGGRTARPGRASARPGTEGAPTLAEVGAAGVAGATGADAPYAAPRGLLATFDIEPAQPRVGATASLVVRFTTDGAPVGDVHVRLLVDDEPVGDLTLTRITTTAAAAIPVTFVRAGKRVVRVIVDDAPLLKRKVRVRR